MFLFAAAFFGGLLLVPTYFQEVRGESTLAGRTSRRAARHRGDDHDADRRGPWSTSSRSVASCRSASSLIAIGMFGLTQIEARHVVPPLIGLLFVMGLGMGGTMMPLFTTALKTLTHHEVARGSTLLNITQQIASSVGVAVISVVLTNQLQDEAPRPAGDRRAAGSRPWPTSSARLRSPRDSSGCRRPSRQHLLGGGGLVLLTFIPVYFLPRKREVTHLLDDEGVPPVVVH